MERPEVFYSPQWAQALQSAYQSSLKPLIFVGDEGEDSVGVACLATGLDEQTITFLGANTGDYCDFVSAPQTRTQFVEVVFGKVAEMKAVEVALANLPAESNTVAALRCAAKKHGFHIYLRPAYSCAQIDLGTGSAREALKSSLLNKKKFRRYLRDLEREGPVTFEHLQSWERIRASLPEFVDAHAARFRATHRVSSLETPERRGFIEELARRFDGSGVVTLSLMKVGDRPIAWNYGFQFGGSWFWYQPAFDSQYEKYSPGYCLLARIVIEACDKKTIRRVDLGLGAEGYKERLANSARQTLYVTLTRSPLRHLRHIARYRLASAVKRSPKLERAIRSVLP